MTSILETLADRANPLLVREVRRALRGRVPATLFLAVQAGLLGFCLARIDATDLQRPGEAGVELSIFLYGVFVLCAWVGIPLFGYSWIWSEKRDRTYELLMLAPLGEGRASAGRLMAGLFLLVYLLSGIAPFVSFAYLLGGIDFLSVAIVLAGTLVVSAAYFFAGVAWSHLPEGPLSFVSMGAVLLLLLVGSGSYGALFLGAFATAGLPRNFLLAAGVSLTAVAGGLTWLARRHGRQEARDERRRPRRPVLIEGRWAIEVERLKKVHRSSTVSVVALDRVSFVFRPGQVTGLVGSNGAGKTTMLRILATVDRPDWGTAWFGPDSLVADPERLRLRIGFVPDASGFYPNQTVWEYLDFFTRVHGLAGEGRRRRIEEVLAFTGLSGLRDREASVLSKGQRQRASFARAILHDPEVLLLDEPMEGLDPRARIEFRELLLALAAQGKAILVSSHVLSEMDEFIDRLVVLEKGRLVLEGDLEALRADLGLSAVVRLRLRGDQDPVAAERALLERPDAVLVRSEGREILVQLEGGDAAGDRLVHDLFAAGIRVEGLRPERPDVEAIFLAATRGEVA